MTMVGAGLYEGKIGDKGGVNSKTSTVGFGIFLLSSSQAVCTVPNSEEFALRSDATRQQRKVSGRHYRHGLSAWPVRESWRQAKVLGQVEHMLRAFACATFP